MEPKHSHVNYLYFGGLFSFLVLLVAGSIFTKENLGGSQFFFFLYALGQVILEISLFIFFGILIRRYLGKFCFALFIGVTFIILFLHLFDFLMDRILDLSVWSALRIFVLDESLENFIYLLEASGIPFWAWGLLFLVLAALPLLGIFIYKLSERLAQKKPFSIRHGHFLQAFICIPAALFLWDFTASKVIDPDAYSSFIKSLPWKYTFLQPQNVLLTLPNPLNQPTDEKLIAAAIEADTTTLTEKPNIYLFIVESLREDAITPEIAPHLHKFKKENIYFDTALSNGNGTHLSWFSIFHSQFPYCWNHLKKHSTIGSPALALLKKWGYQIHLYTSAQLGYYGMEELLFGQNHHLLSSVQTFHHTPPLQPADTDAAALAKLQADIAANPSLQTGQVFIIFWDCTHFDYNWPKNWTPKFVPFAQEFAYFQAFQSAKTIVQIKNRYRNSVNYMDSLFGSFLSHLPDSDSIIIFTGDHGEEFFEHGHLFHNSHLTHEQTNVPLYFRLPTATIPPHRLASQMDIFPTIIDHLSATTPPYLLGASLLRPPTWPYVLISRFNAGSTPYEFCIHNGTNKFIAQFNNRQDIFSSTHLHILSLRTSRDSIIHEPKTQAPTWIHAHFTPAIDRLFGGTRNAECKMQN